MTITNIDPVAQYQTEGLPAIIHYDNVPRHALARYSRIVDRTTIGIQIGPDGQRGGSWARPAGEVTTDG